MVKQDSPMTCIFLSDPTPLFLLEFLRCPEYHRCSHANDDSDNNDHDDEDLLWFIIIIIIIIIIISTILWGLYSWTLFMKLYHTYKYDEAV